eukprot:UN02986
MTFDFGEGFEAPEAPERPEAPEMGEGGFGGFHPAMNMFDPSEHTEDFCANQPIQQCNYPCMNLGGVLLHLWSRQGPHDEEPRNLQGIQIDSCRSFILFVGIDDT